MKFDVTAQIKEIGPVETVGAKGFQKRNLILSEQSGQYDNLICVEFSGDKLTTPEQFSEGQIVSVSGFVNCREWNGKYFTSLRGSFISAPQASPGGDFSQGYQAPAVDQYSQGYAQPPAPQQPQGYAQPPAPQQPQGYAQPPAPQQPQGYAQPPANPSPVPPPFPDNADSESVDDIPF